MFRAADFHPVTTGQTHGLAAVYRQEQVLPAAPSEDFYRITLTGTGEPDLDALRERFAHIPNLELRDRTQPELPVWEDLQEDSLCGTFFRLLRDSNNPHAQLASQISRKLLSGREVRLP